MHEQNTCVGTPTHEAQKYLSPVCVTMCSCRLCQQYYHPSVHYLYQLYHANKHLCTANKYIYVYTCKYFCECVFLMCVCAEVCLYIYIQIYIYVYVYVYIRHLWTLFSLQISNIFVLPLFCCAALSTCPTFEFSNLVFGSQMFVSV